MRIKAFVAGLLGIAMVSVTLPLHLVHAEAPDSLINESFEQEGASIDTAYDWQAFSNGYTRVPTARTGSWSLGLENASKEVLSGGYQRIDLEQTAVTPVFIGGYIKGENIEMAPGSYFGASLYVEMHLQDGSIAYWSSVPNSGTFDWRWVGFNTGMLTHVTQPIKHVFLVPILGNASGKAYIDDLRVTEFGTKQSALTIMIDDGEDSAFTVGMPELTKRGLVASVPVISGSVGTDGFMSQAELLVLQGFGWEIVSHTVTHNDLTAMSTAEMIDELTLSKQTLEGMGLKINNIAVPYGAFNDKVIAESQALYRSMRGYWRGDNPQGIFPYEVMVRSMESKTDSKDVDNWINEAMANGRWEVLVFHKLVNKGDDEYYTTPKAFRNILDAIVKSGISVITYDEGINRFAVTQ